MSSYLRKEDNIPEKVMINISKKYQFQRTEIISSAPLNNYKESIIGVTKAFKFILMAFKKPQPRSIKALEKYYLDQLDSIDKYTINDDQKLNFYQKILIEYLQKLQYKLSTISADLQSVEPAKWLSKADQYVNLTTIRPQLVSVSHLDGVPNGQYLVQVETPQAPMNDDTLKEYLATQQSRDKHPSWYTIMEPYEQTLFNHAMQDILSRPNPTNNKLDILRNNITSISSRLRTIPGMANFSKHQAYVVDQEGKTLYSLPTNLRSSIVSSRDFQEFNFMGTANQTKLDLRGKFTDDNMALIIENFVKSTNISTQELIKKPILIQTLISPQAPDITRKPDKMLFADKNKAICKLLTEGFNVGVQKVRLDNLFYTNHPINHARHVAQTTDKKELGSSKTTPDSINNLIVYARAYMSKFDKNAIAQFDLINFCCTALANQKSKTYAGVLDSKADPHNRELYLASLELLLVSLLDGVAHSTCVSGKDRRAILAMFVDTIAIYQLNYPTKVKRSTPNDIPKQEQDFIGMIENDKFIAIFASIYKSGHHQANAAQNAQGACGIKTPDMYLPDNLIQAIGAERIKQDNRLASNNEYEHLLNKQPNTIRNRTLLGGLIGFIVTATLLISLLIVSLFIPPIGLSLILIGLTAGSLLFGGTLVGALAGYIIAEDTESTKFANIIALACQNEKMSTNSDAMFYSLKKLSTSHSECELTTEDTDCVNENDAVISDIIGSDFDSDSETVVNTELPNNHIIINS